VLGYLPTNFGLPSTFGSRVIHYVRDRQTDRRTKATLNAPYPMGGGIISKTQATNKGYITNCLQRDDVKILSKETKIT